MQEWENETLKCERKFGNEGELVRDYTMVLYAIKFCFTFLFHGNWYCQFLRHGILFQIIFKLFRQTRLLILMDQ